MKINFEKTKKKDIYKVGNVIKQGNSFYLVVSDIDDRYSLVSLGSNYVSRKHDTLEELIAEFAEDGDVLVNAEINVF